MRLTLRTLIVPIAVTAAMVMPNRASAQAEALAALLARITAINAYGTFAKLHPKPPEVATHRANGTEGFRQGLSGYGVEFLFNAKTFRSPPAVATLDTTRKLTSITEKVSGASLETTYTMEASVGAKDKGLEVANLEVALGYSQVSGFFSTDPTIDLRGSIRELPSLAFYLSFERLPWAPYKELAFSPYIGLRSGLVQLHQTRIHDTTTSVPAVPRNAIAYAVDAQSFQAGPVLGLGWGSESVNLFIEAAYMHRNFPSLNVTAKDGVVPARFPRSLNFSGFYYQAGFQVEIGAAKK